MGPWESFFLQKGGENIVKLSLYCNIFQGPLQFFFQISNPDLSHPCSSSYYDKLVPDRFIAIARPATPFLYIPFYRHNLPGSHVAGSQAVQLIDSGNANCSTSAQFTAGGQAQSSQSEKCIATSKLRAENQSSSPAEDANQCSSPLEAS